MRSSMELVEIFSSATAFTGSFPAPKRRGWASLSMASAGFQRSAAPLLTALRDDTNASVDLIVASQAR